MSDRRRSLAIFLLFLGFYLLTASGHFYAIDEETLFRYTESLIERGTVYLPDHQMVVAEPTGDGRFVSQYSPGQSLVAIPFYLIGKVVAPLFPATAAGYVLRFFVGLLGPIVTAATVTLLYALARRLGYRGAVALGLAVAYGLATTAWPHGRTFFAEPLTALCLLGSFALLERGAASLAPRPLLLAGLLAGAAVVTKPQGVIGLPILGLYLLGRVALTSEGIGPRGVLVRQIRAAAWWGLGLGAVLIPYGSYNTMVYGHPLSTGYGAAGRLFTTPFLRGFLGLIGSSGKGILWYAPPIILALLGLRPFLRRHRAEALACAGMFLTHLLFYSRLNNWHGDGAWGPRHLLIALPFAILPLVGWLDAIQGRRVQTALTATIVAVGIALQLLGVLVNFDWYLLRSNERTRHFSPPASPPLIHARMLAERVDEWRLRAFPPRTAALLTAGFAPDEGFYTAGSLFPRWTNGAGEITLRAEANAPLLVKLTFFDHRPPTLRTELATVLVNGVPLPAKALERRDFTGNGEGWTYQFTVPTEALRDGQTVVTLSSPTWRPLQVDQGDRDDTIGVYVHNVEVWQTGQSLPVRESLAIGPLPDTATGRFWWFNTDSPHHLVDHWAWYAAVAGFGQPRATIWSLAILLASAALLGAGWRLARGELPPGALRLRARPARRRRRVVKVRPRATTGN